MISFDKGAIQLTRLLFTRFFLAAVCSASGGTAAECWVGTWATAPLPEAAAKETTPLAGATLRQIVHVSLGGHQLRLRLSNAFGATPLTLDGVHLALAGPAGAIQPDTDRPVRFNGQTSVSVPPGAVMLSDPLDFALPPLADVAVSVHFTGVPATLTVHPGSRTTSYLQAGDALSAPAMPEATKVVRWYFINGIDVSSAPPAAAVVVLGDSITDGYATTTDRNNRWADELAHRLQAQASPAPIGVLNEGIGGNRLLRDGLGPNALARLDRDVLTQAGARTLIVFEGINDIGTRLDARKHGADYASAADIIAAYEQIIARAKTHGFRVIGATITPYAGAGFYWSADGEADRQTVNAWIRHSGRFDAVIDFDAALRDPANPAHLAPPFDSGDHLHPSLAGYRRMGDTVDLSLFIR